jgi:hypothetical protein
VFGVWVLAGNKPTLPYKEPESALYANSGEPSSDAPALTKTFVHDLPGTTTDAKHNKRNATWHTARGGIVGGRG